ncbi:Rho-N domain-containing protein 1, chloroplastic [Quillaja saponaria]|uniref:Rho-N domain-containing protein 1, chloroplastic n=1 Tax=Quillaja saponaria TaxID=32244 RepID=A0AAD7Q9A3_QUISA|nr:Rho-N domain-containing protein 1, chloroplastic [Quillaja saponaria]
MDLDFLAGCGVPEGRCLPFSGVSGRTAAVYSCSSRADYRICSHVKIGSLKSPPGGASFVCEARRNPDFPRQNRHGFFRSRNRQNEEGDSFEDFDEADTISSKNGPLLSLSGTPKFQATAAPGPREKEIVELFRKVQAKLRERTAVRGEKKTAASQGQGKESGTVDSLLKLLRKHSVEQVKRSNGSSRGKDIISDHPKVNGQYDRGQSIRSSDSHSAQRDESQEANISLTRPASNFQRKSPVPRVIYQPVSSDEDTVNSSVPLDDRKRKKNQEQTGLELDPELKLASEVEVDSDPEPEPEHQIFVPDKQIAELSKGNSDDSEHSYNDGNAEEQQLVEHEDYSALKLPELRVLAKSRGLKGFSKMKKGGLVELLNGC